MFYINNLQNFAKNICIIKRDSKNDQIYYYEEVIAAIKEICQKFKELGIRQCADCFAVKLNGITAGSVSLLLVILNERCAFCPLSQNDENSMEFLVDCGATFLVSNIELEYGNTHFKYVASILVFEENFFVYSVEQTVAKFPRNHCYTIGTSGSTGQPKVVHVPFECIAPNIKALCDRFQITRHDVIFLGTPLTFDPFVVEFFMALSCGAALLITSSHISLSSENLANILWPKEENVMNQLGATILQTTPSIFRLFGDEIIRDVILTKSSALRILILGGEEFPKCMELRKWLPPDCLSNKRIFNIYGITELSCWSTIHELNITEIMENKSIPLGHPIDSETVLSIETDEKTSEEATRGELLVGSATRRTYIPQLDKDDDKPSESNILYRHTGDLVERNGSGQIFYLGRLNNVIKRFGKRISLDALEQKVGNMFSSNGLRAIFLWNSPVKSLICVLNHHEEMKMDTKRSIMQNLFSHEKPDWIFGIEKFPLNKHGKIDRKSLLELITPKIKKPVDVFRRFLEETLAINMDEFISTNTSMSKRSKKDESHKNSIKSFTFLGGTSFNALSLATDIGILLSNPNDQRKLLEKLLDPNVAVADVFRFLETAASSIDRNCVNSEKENIQLISTKYLDLIWRIDMQKCIDATPCVNVGRYICIGSHAHLLLTIDCFEQKEICRLKLRSRIECKVAFVSEDLALIGCNAGYLYAFNFLTGVLYWSLYIGTKIKAKPLVKDATNAMIACYDDKWNIVYVCLKTQEIKWRRKVGTKPIFSSPIFLDKLTALVCSLDGTYERIEITTGNSYWTHQCATPIFSTPEIIESELRFCIAEVGGKVHICETESGDILQTFAVDGNIFSNLTVVLCGNSKKIIFGCHDKHVYCLKYVIKNHEAENPNQMELNLQWKTKFDSAIFATPAAAELNGNSFIVVCSTKGSLNILEEATGLVITTHQLEGEIFSSPCCCVKNSNNELHIYFGCRDDYLYCFRFKKAFN